MTERELFLEALKREDLAERQAFLSEQCAGDEHLRRRVDRLLDVYLNAGAFMSQPAADVALGRPAVARPGTQIGLYTLLEAIGQGGMGVVYKAEQKEPVARTVALKIIKPGMDSRLVLARFEAERQALSLMEHPNIARVLDAGTTDTGLPYFVMELVNGIPITRYCDQHRLGVRERLNLLIPVCQAIQHAHHKGIIHRDIKPTNVLVAEFEDKSVPKIIDFGVAKATVQRLTDVTSFTLPGQIIGTLEYMSPEQAELNQNDIDTRSDIYSLGILLYELLTGSTPFDKHRLKNAAFHEMLRIIREDELPRPSTRLSNLGKVGSAHQSPALPGPNVDTAAHIPPASLASIAANRNEDPSRLTKSIRGELDWIVMKSLEKDRSRRYDSASALALDLQRYLIGDQVQACPPSAAYRFRKFVRRHRAVLTAAALFIALLVTGAVVSTLQAIRATRAEARARQNESRALAEEQKAKAAAVAEAEQRKRAEEQTRVVEGQRQLLENNNHVNSMVTDQILSVLKEIPIPAAKRQALLVTVLSRLSDLDPADRVKAFHSVGNQFATMNEYPAAISADNEGLSLDPNNPSILVSRGDVYFRQKEYQKAASDYSAAIENQRPNDSVTALLPFVHRAFARCRLEQFEPALADFRAAFDLAPKLTLAKIGFGFRDSYVTQVANAPFDQRLHAGINALFDLYAADQQQSEANLAFCGEYLAMMKQYDSARKHCEAAVALGAKNYGPYNSLAILALQRGDRVAYREICAAMLTKSAIAQDDIYTSFTAWCCGLGPGALDDYAPVIEIARRSLAKRPSSGQRRQILGMLLLRAGQHEEARQWLVEAIAATDDQQGSQIYRRYYLAMANHRLGRVEEAQKFLRAAGSMSVDYLSWRFQAQHQLIRKEAMQLLQTQATATDAPAANGSQPAS